jgi:hypothetical protein
MSQHILSYLENKAIRDNLPYRYNGETNEGHYILFGLPVSKENIDQLYPLSNEKLTLWNTNHKGDNPDGTRF